MKKGIYYLDKKNYKKGDNMFNDDLRKQHIDRKLNIVWNDIVSITEVLKAGDVQNKDLEDYIKILEEASLMTEEIGLLLFHKSLV